MRKKGYGFSTAIPYGTDIFEVTGTEYCEWEDALEKAGSDSNAMEWATYDFLINNGYFVSTPSGARPKPEGDAGVSGTKGKKVTAETTGGSAGVRPVAVTRPGIRGVPDGFDNLVSGYTREPVWTQSRIFQERDRLLREREKIQQAKEKALEQKIVEQQLLEILYSKPKNFPTTQSAVYFLCGLGLLMALIMIAISNFK